MRTIYDDLLDMVVSLIEDYTPNGNNAIWSVRNSIEVPNEPWKTINSPPTLHNLRILVLPYELHDWPFLKYREKSSIPAGSEIAYFTTQNFEPSLKDSVSINGVNRTVMTIHSRIAPEKKVLLYIVEIQ